MPVQPQGLPGGGSWTIQEAEALLQTLSGVISSRIVARPGGEIEEVHILTTYEVSPKQTVRNVESALLAHFDLELDHRKISVAQSSAGRGPEPELGLQVPPAPRTAAPAEGRILFVDHSLVIEESRRLKARVILDWNGEEYEGTASGANLPRARLEAFANATLRAVEAVHRAVGEDSSRSALALELDGVKVVEALEQRFALVSVHAGCGRDLISLAGTSLVRENVDRAVILGTLQATDRWVRGKIER